MLAKRQKTEAKFRPCFLSGKFGLIGGERQKKKNRNCILFIFAHFPPAFSSFFAKSPGFFGCIKAKGGGVGAKGEEEEI